MEYKELSAALEAILFASGDPVPAERIAQVLGADVHAGEPAANGLLPHGPRSAAAGPCRGLRRWQHLLLHHL